MKPKEASELLEMAVQMMAVTQQGFERFLQARKMAIDALKKQIPMKPKKIDWCSAFKPCAYICPTCGVMLDEPSRENRIPKWKNDVLFCDGCGQAIDWSGYETN